MENYTAEFSASAPVVYTGAGEGVKVSVAFFPPAVVVYKTCLRDFAFFCLGGRGISVYLAFSPGFLALKEKPDGHRGSLLRGSKGNRAPQEVLFKALFIRGGSIEVRKVLEQDLRLTKARGPSDCLVPLCVKSQDLHTDTKTSCSGQLN